MALKKFFSLILALVLALSLVACGGTSENDPPASEKDNPLFGEWREPRDDGFATTYNFKANGEGESFILDMVNYFSYTYDDTTLTMLVHVDDPPIKRVYNYKIENDTLTLSYTNDDGEVKEDVFNRLKK